MSLNHALLLDVCTLMACLSVLALRGGLRHSHPGVIYLVFHFLLFTLRAFGVTQGAETYFSGVSTLSAATPEEIGRALNYADLFLIAATIGWVSARRPKPSVATDVTGIAIHRPYVKWMAIISIPLGLLSIASYWYIPGLTDGLATVSTKYQIEAQTWPTLALCALIYVYGFRWYLIVPLGTYFLFVSLQGEGRYRLILPALLLMFIYLDRRGRRWPNFRIVALVAALFILFFPLKAIGKAYQAGESPSAIVQTVRDSASQTVLGKGSGQGVLDQYGILLTQSDDYGHRFWGKPYLDILTLPIPRVWWPNKPGLEDRIAILSTPDRPLSTVGAVATMPGDLYINFGVPGIIIGGFVIARITLRWYRSAYRSGFGTIQHLMYLTFAAAMVQVFRDGPVSFVTFVLVRNAPLVIVAAAHYNRRIYENKRMRRKSARVVLGRRLDSVAPPSPTTAHASEVNASGVDI